MLVPVLLILTVLFGLALLGRLGLVRRKLLMERWPALTFAGAAVLVATRGALMPAIWLSIAAVAAWYLVPYLGRLAPAEAAHDEPGDREARAVLGVGPNATPSEIRAAYRDKMSRAHPDKGGSHNEAARLTAARDRLLKRRGRPT